MEMKSVGYFHLSLDHFSSSDVLGMRDCPFTLANRDEIVDQTVFSYEEKYIEEKSAIVNVQQQQNASRSHLKLFQLLVKLRQQSPFYGGYQKKVIATSTNVTDNSPIGKEGNQVYLNHLVLQPSEAVVFRLIISPHQILLCQ